MMADNQTATDEAEIEVLYTHGAHSKGVEFDDESEAFELARDLRGFGTDAFDDFDRDPQHALDTAYDTLFEFTVDAELDDVHDTGDLLGELYDRMQGPRTDEQIGYDGSETRSLGVGDVIVVDGQPFMVDRIGFTDMAARYQVELDDSDDEDDDPELVTDGGHPHADDTAAEFEEVSDDDAEHVSEIGATRECAMCGSDTSRSSCPYYFKWHGELRIAEDWSCGDCGLQGTILRRRTDGEIVRMSHLHTGSGFEYPRHHAEEQAGGTTLLTPIDEDDEPVTDGGRDPGEQIGRVADRATDAHGSIDEHVELRVTATLPALDDETVTFTTAVVSIDDDDSHGYDGRYVRLGCEGASDEFIDRTGTECHDLSATFDRHDAVEGVGGSYVSGLDDGSTLLYDDLLVESVEIVDEEE